MNKILFMLCVVSSMVLLHGCEKKVVSVDEYKKRLEAYAKSQDKNGGFVVDFDREVDRFKMLSDEEKKKRIDALPCAK